MTAGALTDRGRRVEGSESRRAVARGESIRRRPPAAVNRTVLGLTGLLVTAVGALALAAHYGRLSWVDAGSPVLADRTRPPTWLLWVVVAVAGVLGLACLRWATAQVTRMPQPVRWRARPPESGDRTALAATTVARPVAIDLEGYDGVRSAAAWVSGPARAPELYLVVTAEPDTDIGALRAHILDHAVPRLCQALEVETVSVAMELRFARAQSTGPSTRST
ncbi:alkaline shock response membrane anchor protein AmaP [Nocardia wallacei]|uniref:alkaline shock response membrane anchor protein AmaP n=1 Tax=Nocardia wallacei TaxID=480035 RepID=UPI0024561BA8|nr:alkaline shock response membrane anchor protein AmaP [Nocardia wallacei]